MALDFKVVEGKLVKVTQAEVSPDELRGELQAEADAAQNELNDAHAAEGEAENQLHTAQEALTAAQARRDKAEEAVNLSKSRLDEFNAAVQVLDDVDGSEAESESPEDSEAVEVAVHVTPTAEA